MIIEQSIKVSNYKCFASQPQGFDRICPINIIIGKNNSGKSSLLDLVNFFIDPKEEFINVGRGNSKALITVTHIVGPQDIDKIKARISNPGARKIFLDHASQFLKSSIKYNLSSDVRNRKVTILENYFSQEPITIGIQFYIASLYEKVVFRRIYAERDILPENESDEGNIYPNGNNATNLIRRILNRVGYDQNLIKKDLLNSLNQICEPEIKFTDILTKQANQNWEVYLEDDNGSWIALSKMGSGVKTILLVLMNLLVIPKLNNVELNYIFGFEELENNLHPSLQKRLFTFIQSFSSKNKVYFFITTHSNVVIDLFGNDPSAQILHVQKQGDHSIVNTITPQHHKNILRDLDFKPSDLLLSNGIIWVEGPSDAIYLELLIDLYRKKFALTDTGKLSYTIQSLSTAIWKYAGFSDFNWDDIDADIQNKIISLAKLNHNHLIVIDNDGNYEDRKPSEWEQFAHGTGRNKAKLIYESLNHNSADELTLETNFGDATGNQLLFWVNDGTFETYLEYFIKNKGTDFAKYFDLNKAGYLEKKRDGENSSISKVILASDIAKFCLEEDLSFDDIAPDNSALFNKIDRLYTTIKSWN